MVRGRDVLKGPIHKRLHINAAVLIGGSKLHKDGKDVEIFIP
jgi:hypothetical protein